MARFVNTFIDTEFTNLVDMDLISISLVTEDGREFYAERSDFELGLGNDFVRSNVLPLLGAPGVAVYAKPDLLRAVDAWLTPFAKDRPVICFDQVVDWAMLWDLYDKKTPGWLSSRNIRDNLDFNQRAKFFSETGLIQHHALNDAHANRCAMMLDPILRFTL